MSDVLFNQPRFAKLSTEFLREVGAGALLRALRDEGIGPSQTGAYVFCSFEYFESLRAELARVTVIADGRRCPECDTLRLEAGELRGEIEALARYKARLREIVDEQADDAGLWFEVWGSRLATAPEKYLQQELRRLHAAIEEHGDVGRRDG